MLAQRIDTQPDSFLDDDVLEDGDLWQTEAFVGGRWYGAGRNQDVRDPATGATIATVPVLDAAWADEAVEQAHEAFAGWRALLPQARAGILMDWHDGMMAAREDLARLMTLEQGKPLDEARGEIDYAAGFIKYYAEQAKRTGIESVTSHLPGAAMSVRRMPVGVAALVTPWNFPSAMITRKAAAALAAGCTVVVHPSMETPFSALALAVLAERAGMPAGVFSVVTGEAPEIVGAWCRNPKVRALSFTGSTEVGRLLLRQSADTVKLTSMELGGHAPFIVFPDADVEAAVDAAVAAKFATSGQDCLAANRIYVHEDIREAFVAAFTRKVAALKVGNGFERGVEIGPLMHARAVEKCDAHVADAVSRGARCETGGGRHEAGKLFYKPTVLSNVPADADIMHEETFGPVAAIATFNDDDAVLAAANDTEYGLVAYIFTEDRRRIARFTDALEYGMVAVNRVNITGAPVPFGGVKQSGLGREGSRHGLEAFTEIKYVCEDIS